MDVSVIFYSIQDVDTHQFDPEWQNNNVLLVMML